jgi:predicted naringenin-chalcone synthase
LTGIEKRHLAALDYTRDIAGKNALYLPAAEQPLGPGMGARTVAFDAAAGSLVREAMAGFSPESLAQVTNVVTVSCTHASSPGLEQPVLAHAAISRDVHRWNLGFMGCSAGLAALRLVHRIGEATSLIVACELSSLHFQYTDQLDQLTANALFADGAAALLLSPRPSPMEVLGCGCATLPQFADQMVWFAGDHGLQLRLSQDLPETLGAHLRPAIAGVLRRHGASIDEVQHWLVHPGGPQILDCAAESLGLDAQALDLSRDILRQFGNMSSPTIFFILKRLIEARGTGLVGALAFGPGLTIEVVLLRVSEI